MHRPVRSLKARGESTSAGCRPACSLATDCRKSSQIISPVSGQAATSPCLIAAPRTPFDLLRNIVSCHSVQQFIERVTRLTRWLEDGAQHQCSVFDSYFGTLAVADLKGIGDRLRDAHGETISPSAEFNDHGASP